MSFGGGAKPMATGTTVASGVQIQTSCYGNVVPVVFGQTRVSGNLIFYGNFQAIPVKSQAGNGGKGGGSGGGTTTYDYKASFMFSVGEGTNDSIKQYWSSKSKSPFSSSGFTFKNGSLGQSKWGPLNNYVTDPNQYLAYGGLSYVAVDNYDLGSSAQIPNLSWELKGHFPDALIGYSTLPDADPADVVTTVLTNNVFGAGFPSARLANLSTFSSYCRAAGLVVSPCYDQQDTAGNLLNQLVQSCNSEFVWSGAQLNIVPRGDKNLSANGATYTAPAAPEFDLTDDDFLDAGDGSAPVQCTRSRPSDQINRCQIEYLSRNRDYNTNIVSHDNLAAITAYGLRIEQPVQMHWFCDENVAKRAVTLRLQRQSVRNVYTFKLGWRYILLDPMDIVTITDANLGLTRQWVRILTMEEDDEGAITVTAEEYLNGTGAAALYSFEQGSPYIPNHSVDPGNVNNPPMIFEPASQHLALDAHTTPKITVAASGGPNWGGAYVWISLDGTRYKRMTKPIVAPSRQGKLTANIAAWTGTGADTTNSLLIDLSASGGTLDTSVTHADADNFRTLCKVGLTEVLSYGSAVAGPGPNQYTLSYLQRGLFGTPSGAHIPNAAFTRLDESCETYDLPFPTTDSDGADYSGTTIHVKFQSFNVYGQGLQDLSAVTDYTYTIGGNAGTIIGQQIAQENYAVTIPDGSSALFSLVMPFAGTLSFTAVLAMSENGTATVGKLSVKKNGSEVIAAPWSLKGNGSIVASVANSITVASGDTVQITSVVTNLALGGEANFNGGTAQATLVRSK